MANQVPGQITLDFSSSLVAKGLNRPDVSSFVYDFSGGYNVVDYMVTSAAPARRVEGADGFFQKPVIGKSSVVGEVATNTPSGANIVLTFVDNTYDLFRLKMTVMDGTANGNLGRVIATAPGTVTLEPAPSVGTTFVGTTAFAAGTFCSAIFQSAGNRGSEGMVSLYEAPVLVDNRTSITRESLELFRRDMNQTYPEYMGNHWYYYQEEAATQRFARYLEYKALWGAQGATGQIANSTLEGAVNYSMGLKEAIQDPVRGGVYQPMTSIVTETEFGDFIIEIADQQGNTNAELTCVVGREMLKIIQQFPSVQSSIQFAGQQTTFGGSAVTGLNVHTYAIAGVTCNFIQAPALNDKWIFPEVSALTGKPLVQYICIVLDLNNYNAVGGSTQPASEKVYFGPREVEYALLPGTAMTGTALDGVSVFNTTAPIAVSQRDGARMEIYSDCAYDFMGHNMGWLELLA